MAMASFTSMFSTRLPTVFTAQKVPPSTLALPGPVHTVVTPPRAASRMQGCMGLKPSIPRIWGEMGSFISL